MFKQLRNRFLILNLVTISVMMLIAFVSIYVITYSNTQKEIKGNLFKFTEKERKPNDNPRDQRGNFGNPPLLPGNPNTQPPSDRAVSFTIITDKEWNKVGTSSIFSMDDTFYESAKNAAVAKKSDIGNIKVEGTHWAFIKIPTFDGYRIVFLDTTQQHSILTNLIYTFLFVAAVMLIFIFLISRHFANRSIQPIKEAFDKQKQFIADASHELKTPLTVINTNVDVLLSNGEDRIMDQTKWLHYIKSEVERMTTLTNDLLYLTQVDYSDIQMIFTDFDLSETVENVILTMEAVIFENNISLDYAIEPNLMLHGNNEQIKQLVMILLDNALKYTNSKGSVKVSLQKHHNSIALSVTNTGEGIPEESIHKIFDRFYRVDKSRARKSGGYGLGLAIAKTITEQHGGKISVKSVVNESTSFTAEFPRFNS